MSIKPQPEQVLDPASTVVESNVQPTAESAPAPEQAPQASIFAYHFAGFRVSADGKNNWYDGVANLNGLILNQEHYQCL